MTPTEFRDARLRLGISQHHLGVMLGYADTPHTRQQIHQMEKGGKPVRPWHCRLMRAYLSGYRPDDWPSKSSSA